MKHGLEDGWPIAYNILCKMTCHYIILISTLVIYKDCIMVYDIMHAPNHIIIGNKFLCTQYYKDTGGKGLYAHKYNITNIVIARK